MDIFRSISLLLAGIGVFLLGIKLMSNGLEKGAGKGVKKMFARIGDNRFANAGIGGGATAAIQSSTAVTVMIVGFANAGVITLLQATAIIMGANLGTTLTAFFAVIDSLPISSVFMMSGIVGVSMFVFSKKPKVKLVGEIITGLAIIFVGMNLMGRAFPADGPLHNAFNRAFGALAGNIMGPLLLMLLGAVFTAVIQSSTAATNMIVLMVGTNVLPLEAAIFIILGANLGTTLTVVIASIGMSTNAKRAALTHVVYNSIGVIIFLPILWILSGQVSQLLTWMSGGNAELATAFMHFFYNILLFLILIGFTRPLTKLVTVIVPVKKGEEHNELKLLYINERVTIPVVIPTPEDKAAAQEPVFKEILHMASLARSNLKAAFDSAVDPNNFNPGKMVSTEQKINFVNKGIGRHLVKLSKIAAFKEDEKFLNSLHHAISDIERIGDHAMTFLDEVRDMREQKVVFSPNAISDLEEMFALISGMFELSLEIFATRNPERLDLINQLRRQITDSKRELGFRHIKRLNKDECNVEAGVHFYAIVICLERVKVHLSNIAYSVRTTAGTELERLKNLAKQKTTKRKESKKVYW